MRIKIILFWFVSIAAYSQQKSTGVVPLSSNMSVNVTLNNTTSQVIITFTGPNDRWFALQFGSFANGGGMQAGTDVVYWNNTTVVDARQNGIGIAPSVDAVNNWTLISNTNNTPATGLRTITFSRPLNTGDSNDYQFSYAASTIDLVWARGNTTGYTLAYHGNLNKGYAIDTPFTTLGLEEIDNHFTKIYPNPSNGRFTIETKTAFEAIKVYNQTGSLITTISNNEVTNSSLVNLEELQEGIYYLQIYIQGSSFWKKIIIQ